MSIAYIYVEDLEPDPYAQERFRIAGRQLAQRLAAAGITDLRALNIAEHPDLQEEEV